MGLGISYSKFRKLFNSTTSTDAIKVFIHEPNVETPRCTTLNISEEFDKYEITKIEWSVVKIAHHEPQIWVDVWVD